MTNHTKMNCHRSDWLLSYKIQDGGQENQNKMADITFLIASFLYSAVKIFITLLWQYSLLLLLSVILGLMLYIIYKAYISPDLYIKELTEVGFDHIQPGKDRDLRINRARRMRRIGVKMPPPYPNGWFSVAESEEVGVGRVIAVDALGHNLAVYRGEDGVVRCVDAYCPHLGSHLAVGGKVAGSCIQCPFHKWCFGPDGKLVSVPGVDAVPKGVSIKTWRTVEADCSIWIWYDAEDRPPLWPLEDAPQLKEYSYRGRNEFTVNCHIQEIPENGADVAHLNAVHADSLVTRLGVKHPFLLNFVGSHYWNAEWSRNEGHTSTIKLTHDYKLLKMNLVHMDVEVTQTGPGQVLLLLQTPLGPILISQSVTPLSPMQQRVVHRVFSPARSAVFAFIINRGESYQIQRDIQIWNSKCYVAAPAYVKADKTIRAFRNWYSQFYSERSISFQDAINGLDW